LGKVNLTMVEQEKATYKHCNLITSQALNNWQIQGLLHKMKLDYCEIHDNIRWPRKCHILELFQNTWRK
jgi:hypothetical protein